MVVSAAVGAEAVVLAADAASDAMGGTGLAYQ